MHISVKNPSDVVLPLNSEVVKHENRIEILGQR